MCSRIEHRIGLDTCVSIKYQSLFLGEMIILPGRHCDGPATTLQQQHYFIIHHPGFQVRVLVVDASPRFQQQHVILTNEWTRFMESCKCNKPVQFTLYYLLLSSINIIKMARRFCSWCWGYEVLKVGFVRAGKEENAVNVKATALNLNKMGCHPRKK